MFGRWRRPLRWEMSHVSGPHSPHEHAGQRREALAARQWVDVSSPPSKGQEDGRCLWLFQQPPTPPPTHVGSLGADAEPTYHLGNNECAQETWRLDGVRFGSRWSPEQISCIVVKSLMPFQDPTVFAPLANTCPGSPAHPRHTETFGSPSLRLPSSSRAPSTATLFRDPGPMQHVRVLPRASPSCVHSFFAPRGERLPGSQGDSQEGSSVGTTRPLALLHSSPCVVVSRFWCRRAPVIR